MAVYAQKLPSVGEKSKEFEKREGFSIINGIK